MLLRANLGLHGHQCHSPQTTMRKSARDGQWLMCQVVSICLRFRGAQTTAWSARWFQGQYAVLSTTQSRRVGLTDSPIVD
eukprot:m.238263 g.238263  ORF g.238263 m.238263 type:complete len:80 (-) comp15805_c0_seq10:6-245(-)